MAAKDNLYGYGEQPAAKRHPRVHAQRNQKARSKDTMAQQVHGLDDGNITGLQRQQTRVMSLAGNEHAPNTAVRERRERLTCIASVAAVIPAGVGPFSSKLVLGTVCGTWSQDVKANSIHDCQSQDRCSHSARSPSQAAHAKPTKQAGQVDNPSAERTWRFVSEILINIMFE